GNCTACTHDRRDDGARLHRGDAQAMACWPKGITLFKTCFVPAGLQRDIAHASKLRRDSEYKSRDNIFYSALTGADRQQRHAPMTRRLSQTGAVRTFARSSRSAAATGSSILSFRPNRMASPRMRAAISQI